MHCLYWPQKQARWACVLAVLLLGAVPIAAPAQAMLESKGATVVRAASPRRARPPGASGRGGYVYPNGETAAQRERRLKRECKGRPNAGACLGFGQTMG